MEELTQARLQQSRQLADARQQAYTQERSGGEGGRGKTGRLEEELRTAQCELKKAKEREKQVSGGFKCYKCHGGCTNQPVTVESLLKDTPEIRTPVNQDI